jgi:hypothetical protein
MRELLEKLKGGTVNLGWIRIPRYFYHKPPRGRSAKQGIKAYPNRGLDGSTPHIEAAFKTKNPKIIWLGRKPEYGEGTFVVDVSKLDVKNIRDTGQAEGNIWHKGDIPASAIVGITDEDGNIREL